MNILGIETSCDETAVAVVADGRRVLANAVFSQVAAHTRYGGVVPEVAARSHVEVLPVLADDALRSAGMGWSDLDGLAVTRGPGLASSLLIGLTAAKSLALSLNKPLAGINHLEAHLWSIQLSEDCPAISELCPLLFLLVSGGHTLLVHSPTPGQYRLLGQTLDDAAGEALDKGAALLKLGYPGGPAIEQCAKDGDPAAITFPRALTKKQPGRSYDGLDAELCFSFSGLKTALLYYLKDNPAAPVSDVAASYQEAVFDALLDRVIRALGRYPVRTLACVGGVSRNARLRQKLRAIAGREGDRLVFSKPEYCTDNAAMIAGVAAHRFEDRMADPAHLEIDPNLPLLNISI